jgi:hypothetical protein
MAPGPSQRDATWAALHGLVRRSDALVEYDETAVRRLLRGPWTHLLPATYATSRSKPTREQRLAAALLYAGPSAQLASVTACRELGVADLPETDTVHVLTDARWPRASCCFVTVRTSERLPRPVLLGTRSSALAVSQHPTSSSGSSPTGVRGRLTSGPPEDQRAARVRVPGARPDARQAPGPGRRG